MAIKMIITVVIILIIILKINNIKNDNAVHYYI